MSSKPDPTLWFFVYVVTLYGLAVLGAATLGVVIATAIKAAFF